MGGELEESEAQDAGRVGFPEPTVSRAWYEQPFREACLAVLPDRLATVLRATGRGMVHLALEEGLAELARRTGADALCSRLPSSGGERDPARAGGFRPRPPVRLFSPVCASTEALPRAGSGR